MGLVQYSAKFMPDVASVAKPIQELTRKSTKFVWGAEQQTAFQELKRMITQADTLAYYKVSCRTRIVADVSPVGLGAVLTQLQGDVWRVIAYASRSLTDVERRYSQTEKEALALVWACERFTIYVSGQHFAVCANREMGFTPAVVRFKSCVSPGKGKHCQCSVEVEFQRAVGHRRGV